MDVHSINVLVHIATGAVALTLGLVPLATAKGGASHRKWGRYFAVLASITIITAVIGATFFNAPAPLVAATFSAAYQYISSLRALANRQRGPGIFDTMLALGALMLGVFLIIQGGRSTASWSPMIGHSAIGFAMMVALYDLSRIFWADTWIAKAQPLDHGLKMAGAYFAMMSAGFGNIFRDWQPYSQFGPSLLGLALVPVFILMFRRQQGLGSIRA